MARIDVQTIAGKCQQDLTRCGRDMSELHTASLD
jgi:hypothetical protein